MQTPKSAQARVKELQALLATPAGRAELQAMAESYFAAGGRMIPKGSSLVTYILVHERERGQID